MAFQQQLSSQNVGQVNPASGAFDQNTYMQLLQRQNSMPRPGMLQGPRPQSRGRVAANDPGIFGQVPQGQPGAGPNQTLNHADSSILLSPPGQQPNVPTQGNMNFTQA